MSELSRSATIIVLSIFCYWVCLSGDFVFDDTEAIVTNKDVITDTNISQVFANDFWGTNMSDNSSHKSYRPITVLVFRSIRQLSNLMFGEMSPFLFHIFNLIAYVFFNILLWQVLDQLFQLMDISDHNKNTQFVITILFVCHPIHSEVVCACVGLADLLSSNLFLITLVIYIRFTKATKRQNYVSFTLNSIVITLMTALAMLAKEQGLASIGLCIIFDGIIIINKINKTKISLLIYRIICLSFGSFLLLLLRLKAMDFKRPKFQSVDNPSSFESSILTRIINYNYIYTINAWILLLPDWLCYDWSMSCIALIRNPTDYRLSFVALFWMILFLLFRSSFFNSNPVVKRQLQIGLSFLLIPFIPSTNIFFTVGFVVAERALFLSSIGFIIIITSGINILQRFKKHQNFINFFIIYLVTIWAIRTCRRSTDWVDESRLFESGLRVCPSNAKIHYNIAKNSADLGFRDKAINYYKDAIRLNPEYEQALNNLANILKDSGQLNEAQDFLLKAVQIRPTFATAWMNLGIVQAALKQYSDAENSYLNAIKHRQDYAFCYYNLGNLYVQQKRFDDAYRVWRRATRLKPKLLSAWNNLIIMLDNVRSFEQAQSIALEALQHHSNESSVHFNYANVLGKMKQFPLAEQHFHTAIALDPNRANYYLNLAILYHQWKQYSKAFSNYQKALQIEPNSESVRKNLNILLRTLNNTKNFDQ